MKARNAREREVITLSKQLPDLTDAQRKWIRKKVVARYIVTSGKRHWCTECGDVFHGVVEGKKAVCPHCGTELPILRGRQTKLEDFAYVRIITTCGGYQVLRYILVQWWLRKESKPQIKYKTIFEMWCQPGRETITLGCELGGYPGYRRIPYSLWSDHLSIKHGYYYKEWMDVAEYPVVRMLPVYRKVIGGNPIFARYTADDLFGSILSCPYFESLYKAGDYGHIDRLLPYTALFNKYWPSVKVALRHGYMPESLSSYFDLLEALKFLHYDMRNPKFVAPRDFHKMHDTIINKYRKRLDYMYERREERAAQRRALEHEEYLRVQKENAAKCEVSYAQRIAKFADLSVSNGTIIITPLMSVQAFIDEGEAMCHCVFSREYYKKANSLILSARNINDGNRVETIEVDLDNFVVLQSQGKHDLPTPYHDEIINLVRGSMPMIRRMKRRRKTSAKRLAASRS